MEHNSRRQHHLLHVKPMMSQVVPVAQPVEQPRQELPGGMEFGAHEGAAVREWRVFRRHKRVLCIRFAQSEARIILLQPYPNKQRVHTRALRGGRRIINVAKFAKSVGDVRQHLETQHAVNLLCHKGIKA